MRTAAIEEYRETFAPYLEGPFRELASDQIGDAAVAIDEARYVVSIEGSVPDPSDLAHLQAVRAFARFLTHTSGAIAVANDLSLRWQDCASLIAFDPPTRVLVDEWIEVLYDDEAHGIHTRGMMQFARPDIAIFGCPPHRLERAAQLLRHVAHLEAYGVILPSGTSLPVEGPTSSSPGERVTIAALDAPRCDTLAVRKGTLLVEGWQHAFG